MLLSAVVSWGQDIALMQSDDGTWILAAMPAYDVSLQVEYASDSIPAPADEILLSPGADGTWILAAMPACDVSLEVEYENDSIPAPADDIFLIHGTDSTWTLPSMPACDVVLVVEYEDEDIPVNPDDIFLTHNSDGTWTLARMPDYDVQLEIEYDDEELPVPIEFATAVEPFDVAQPGEAVTTESGIVISLDDSDTVDPVEGSVTLHTTYTTDELASMVSDNVPGSSSFAEAFKGVCFFLAAGKGRVELDIETLGNYMMSVVENSQLIGNYAKTVKGTIVIEYDVEADTWFFAYPSVSTPSGIRRANASDTDGGLKLFSIRIIPEEIYDPDGIASPLAGQEDGAVYNLGGQRLGRLRHGLNIVGGRKILVK